MSNPKRISKGVLKSKMLEYFREVENTGIEIIVLDNNKPVLKISPLEKKTQTAASVFKKYRNQVKYKEDLTATTEDEWSEL